MRDKFKRLDILYTPNEYVNLEIVKEFYVDTKLTDDAPLERVSWVRGKQVPYYKDDIHAYIEHNYMGRLRKKN